MTPRLTVTVLAALWVTLGRCDASESPGPGCDNGKLYLDRDLPEDATYWDCPVSPWPESTQKHLSIDTEYDPEPGRQICMNERISYDQSIPSSGAFRPVAAESGEFLYCPPQRWLNNLHRAATVLLYHPCASPRERRFLSALGRSCLQDYVMTPHPRLRKRTPVALVSWGRTLELSTAASSHVCHWLQETTSPTRADGASPSRKYTLLLVWSSEEQRRQGRRKESLRRCCERIISESSVKTERKIRPIRAATRGRQERVKSERENSTRVSRSRTGNVQRCNSTLGPTAACSQGNGTLLNPPGPRGASSQIQHVDQGLTSRPTSETAGPERTALRNPDPSTGVPAEGDHTARPKTLALRSKDKGTESVMRESKDQGTKSVMKESKDQGTESVMRESKDRGTESVMRESKDQGAESVMKESKDQGAESVMKESKDQGAESVMKESKDQGAESVMKESKDQGTESVMTESKGQGAESVMTESKGQGTESVMKESKDQGAESVMKESKDQGTESVMTESKGQGTESVMKESKDQGAESIMKESKDQGAESVIKESKDQGAESVMKESKDQGAESVIKESKDQGTESVMKESKDQLEGMLKDTEVVDVRERELDRKQASRPQTQQHRTPQPDTRPPSSEDPGAEARAALVNQGLPRTPRTDEAVWAAAALGFLLILLTLSVLHTRLYRNWRTTPSLYWHDPQQDYDSVADVIRRRLRIAKRRRRRGRRQECVLLPSSSSSDELP